MKVRKLIKLLESAPPEAPVYLMPNESPEAHKVFVACKPGEDGVESEVYITENLSGIVLSLIEEGYDITQIRSAETD